jgi:group I intron endonuclease
MRKSGIYKIQSKIKPNRSYIGSAVDISTRWRKHKSLLSRNIHFNAKLQNHYNKYGGDDLAYSIICECSKSELLIEEQYFIDSLKPHFNIRLEAKSNLGLKRSDESRKRMSEAQQKAVKYYSPETRKIMGNYHLGNKNNLGKHHSEKTKEIIRLKLTGRKHKEDIRDIDKWIENISKSTKGKKKPPRTKEHIENWRRSRMRYKKAS